MFNETHPENPAFNQYWYDSVTVDVIVEELSDLVRVGEGEGNPPVRIAFLSTPSIFHAACKRGLIKNCFLFEFDPELLVENHSHYIKFDFRSLEFEREIIGSFHVFVIDPPFISKEVIDAYANAYRILRTNDDAKVIITSIAENEPLLHAAFGHRISSPPFKPTIPNLVYQYSLFVNYDVSLESQFSNTHGKSVESIERKFPVTEASLAQ
jgi:hypothetical protein